MLHALFSAALASLLLTADAPLSAGTQLTFRGSVEPQDEQSPVGQKSFEFTVWVLSQNATGADVAWLVDERGKGQLPWVGRFGRTRLDARWRGAVHPAVLIDRGDGRSVVPIPWPFFVAENPLSTGASFAEDKLEFKVERPRKVDGRAAWLVSVRDAFGPKRTLSVEQQSPLVLATNEKLTLGRGEPYQLKLDLAATTQVAGQHFEALLAVVDKLTALSSKLNVPAGTQEIDWKSDQLAALGEQLPSLSELAVATPLAKLVEEAKRDHQLQAGRSSAVGDLAKKHIGQPIGEFTIPQLAGGSLSQDDLKGKVTVLHFWDYRDEPLKEPYGQVGYLDFLSHRRQKAGVNVYGVAVDGRLADEKTRAASLRSVRKLKEFMNLSYPILLDAGGLLKQFGDPRVVGAHLPLFVVVGPDQKILHYHVGTYDVNQDQGLKELDDVVTAALPPQ